MQFEWDDGKAQANLAKHGVSFDEAQSCFYDPQQIAFYDPDHSEVSVGIRKSPLVGIEKSPPPNQEVDDGPAVRGRG
ncbi:MAG: BrnT family toxin, partial [Nevskia sp.]|nr:BrnT family toxin [Nevskia sp.]